MLSILLWYLKKDEPLKLTLERRESLWRCPVRYLPDSLKFLCSWGFTRAGKIICSFLSDDKQLSNDICRTGRLLKRVRILSYKCATRLRICLNYASGSDGHGSRKRAAFLFSSSPKTEQEALHCRAWLVQFVWLPRTGFLRIPPCLAPLTPSASTALWNPHNQSPLLPHSSIQQSRE